MGHTHTIPMKTDKLFCLCPEVRFQVCLPGSSNVWLSRTDRIQTEILCHFLAVPGLPYNIPIVNRERSTRMKSSVTFLKYSNV